MAIMETMNKTILMSAMDSISVTCHLKKSTVLPIHKNLQKRNIIRNVERYLVACSLSEISKWNITDKI
jgi:hypothetical protein